MSIKDFSESQKEGLKTTQEQNNDAEQNSQINVTCYGDSRNPIKGKARISLLLATLSQHADISNPQ